MSASLPAFWESRLPRWEERLQRLARWQFVTAAVLAALLLSLAFHAPKFWLLRSGAPESFEWSRGLTFRAQATAPWEAAAEPAMRWRVVPAWTAYLLGLRGDRALLLPWLGLAFWLAVSATLLEARGCSRLATASALVVLATTGSALAATNWLGINDGWYLAGLTAVVLSTSPYALGPAVVLCPWVDERFLMAMPLAIACRLLWEPRDWRRDLAILGGGIGFYVALRLGAALFYSAATSSDQNYLRDYLKTLPTALTFGPLGWFMGWRAAWLLLLAAPLLLWSENRPRLAALLALLGLGTLASQGLLIADHSRTCIVLLPLALLAILQLSRLLPPARHALLLLVLALVSLVAPFAHVTFNKIAPVNSLPWELLRLRKSA